MGGQKIEYKVCSNAEMQVQKASDQDGGHYVIRGYANTKNNEDSYGDIPIAKDGESVYNLDRYNMNPVLLVDHRNSSGSIIGQVEKAYEDEKGLYIEAKLMPLEKCYTDEVKHAVSCAIEGMAKAFSVAGTTVRDPKNRDIINKFNIYEISLVAVPADPNSLRKNLESDCDEASDIQVRMTLAELSLKHNIF